MRAAAIQPDMFGGPDVVGAAYEPEFFAWEWCGMFFPPTAEEVRQMKMLRADTLTVEEAERLDRMALVRERADADPTMNRFNRDIIDRGARLVDRRGVQS